MEDQRLSGDPDDEDGVTRVAGTTGAEGSTERLGPYLLEQELGRGGMGQVYRAFDPRLGRRVAIKVLASQTAADAAFRDRFLRESRILASLDHPNIVPIFDAGEADGRLYICMRYVEGSDLHVVLAREGPLSVARAVEILGPVARALDAAHARGVVHRDVKPENVLLTTGGDVYLSDFGIAKQTATPLGATATGVFVGTPNFVAPEQIEGAPVTSATDAYALGCLLFRCLTGQPPFARSSEAAVLVAHLHEEPPSVSGLRPDLGEPVDAVIARALSKRPQDRFPTCRELIEAVAVAVGQPASAERKRGGAASASATDAAESDGRPPARTRGRERRYPARRLPAPAWVVAGLVLALVGAGALAQFASGPGGNRPPASAARTGLPAVIDDGRGVVSFDVAGSPCAASRSCLIFVLDGLRDPEGEQLTLASVGPSAGGNTVSIVTHEGRQVAHWIAARDFTGTTDTFEFTVLDGGGNITAGTCRIENIPPPQTE